MRPIKTPDCTSTYGAPRGSIDVGGMPYFRTQDTSMYGRALPVIHSVWSFTAEERAAIAAGQNVELAIWGEPIPPVSMILTEASEVARETGPLERSCSVCGAAAGQPCVFSSDHGTDADLEPDERLRGGRKGQPRPVPHFYR